MPEVSRSFITCGFCKISSKTFDWLCVECCEYSQVMVVEVGVKRSGGEVV